MNIFLVLLSGIPYKSLRVHYRFIAVFVLTGILLFLFVFSVSEEEPDQHHVCRTGPVSSGGPRAHVSGERAALWFVPGSHLPAHLHPGNHLPHNQGTRTCMCPDKCWMRVTHQTKTPLCLLQPSNHFLSPFFVHSGAFPSYVRVKYILDKSPVYHSTQHRDKQLEFVLL